MTSLIFSTLFIFVFNVPGISAFLPYYHFPIEGQLVCEPKGGSRLNVNALVEVWEEDTVTSDDFIARANVTNGQQFEAIFEHMELGSISPYLIISHDCNPKVVFQKCYARTIYPIVDDHHAVDLGETVHIEVNLLSPKYKTSIICGSRDAYPFQSSPALFHWFQHLASVESTEEDEVDVQPESRKREVKSEQPKRRVHQRINTNE